MDDIKYIIESLLFVADEPLTVDRIKKILIQVETGKIRDALSFRRAVTALSESRIPETDFPLAFKAVYSNTGMVTAH